MPQKTRLSGTKPDKYYEQLGRMIENTYLIGALDKKRLFKNSFLKGLAAGFGGVLGATILIAILLWILSQFQEVPFVGPIFESLERTIAQ